MSKHIRNILAATLAMALCTNAIAFHYCKGKITNIVTRASSEGTMLTIEGMTGWAKIGYGGTDQAEMQKRQFAMLLTAYMAGQQVNLEFEENGLCTDNHDGKLIRYVHFSN